ncbi:MAG: HD domain-containing protein [Negativibacillus sp.]|nr:HD domain-containing protein [Negativibacillus sp.]
MELQEQNWQQKFEELFCQNINREGAQQLLEWLKKTDFFTAPASTKYHCACEHGLVMHSISVFQTMVEQYYEDGDSMESFAICGLLHDVCKAQFYKVSSRNVKNAEGRWEAQPFYTIEDQFPYGHGEKSVFLIERFLRLKPSEAVAIRWHMGSFDEAARGGSFAISQAYDRYPLAVKLHLADLQSTYLREKGTSSINGR